MLGPPQSPLPCTPRGLESGLGGVEEWLPHFLAVGPFLELKRHPGSSVCRGQSRAALPGELDPYPGTPRLQPENLGWRSCSSRHLCVCLLPRRAFQQFYKQFVEYTCPTEDIYLE